MLKMTSSGSTARTEKFLTNAAKPGTMESQIKSLAAAGVRALASATPADTGATAAAWDYEIVSTRGSTHIYWTNSHQNKGANIAVILQFGHGTGTGGYVQGRDYINPAIRPIFDQIADKAWKAVTSA